MDQSQQQLQQQQQQQNFNILCRDSRDGGGGADVRRAGGGAPAVMAPCGVTPFLRALLLPDRQQKSQRDEDTCII